MSGGPPVSVLLCVHNDQRFVSEAIDSILSQTFADFELIIIDDGSTDSTPEILARISDRRVHIVRNPSNRGLTASLNLGLGLCHGRYIARMDADDIAEPRRIERQFDFLEAHPEVGILGCARRLIDEVGNEIAVAPVSTDDLSIRWKCLLGCPFGHPTVMLRRDALERHALRYDESFRTAQDYELWTRLLPVTRGANLPDPLLRYRLRNGVSQRNKTEQLANHDRIALAAIRNLVPGFAISPEQVTGLRCRYGGFSVRDSAANPSDKHWAALYLKLLEAFVRTIDATQEAQAFALEQREMIQSLSIHTNGAVVTAR